MKPFVLSGLAAVAALVASAQTPAPASSIVPFQVAVDPRVELLSIIFRLAGNPEYAQGRIPAYLKDIDEHFATAREHPTVSLARDLRVKRGISFDAPMSLAVHLKDVETLELRVPLDPWPEGIDKRWRANELQEFLSKARDFVKQTQFKQFVAAHQKLYDAAGSRTRELIQAKGHLEWFDKFFGARPGAQFRLAPALVNGGCCYGARIQLNQGEELYCILGVWRIDSDGQPAFETDSLDTVIHEFGHSYINPHIYAATSQLESAGPRLFAKVQARMQRMAYGNWQTMLHESVVRASVVRYLNATQGAEVAAKKVRQEIDSGFLWMKELADLLGQYESQRDKYPKFVDFMPRIVEFFKTTAANMPLQAAAASPKSSFKLRTVKPDALRGQPREMAQDDDQPAGKQSMAGTGHAVRFDSPGDRWFLTSVRVHGARYGAAQPPAENFHIWLCDKDYKVVADFPFPYSRFERGAERWVSFDVTPTEVPPAFLIGVGFNPTATKGVYVSRDAVAGGKSFTGLPGQTPRPCRDGDWLIRAVLDEGAVTP